MCVYRMPHFGVLRTHRYVVDLEGHRQSLHDRGHDRDRHHGTPLGLGAHLVHDLGGYHHRCEVGFAGPGGTHRWDQ